MSKISRRDVLSIGTGVVGGVMISSCCPLLEFIAPESELYAKYCNAKQNWKDESQPWWQERKEQREKEREGVELRYPHLRVGWLPPSQPFHEQVKGKKLNELWNVSVVLENLGNAPSWNTVVESFEGNWQSHDGMKYQELTPMGRIITVIHPGEAKEILVPFKATKRNWGYFCLRCYDPLWDSPETFIQRNQHRKHWGGGWIADFENPDQWPKND